MPFTFAHPAAILPFKNRNPNYFSNTGLFIGSLVPDFEYFIRFTDTMHWGHYWWGLFVFDLPLGLLLCFLFHNIIRDSLLPHLPPFVQRRLAVHKNLNWNRYFAKRWFAVIFSLLLASSLHILWDAFTHFLSDAILATEVFPEMDSSVRSPMVYYGIWGLSTLLGFAALLVSFYNLPATASYSFKPRRSNYWARASFIAFLVIVTRVFTSSNLSIIDLAVSYISALLIGVVLSSAIAKLFYNNERVERIRYKQT